MKILGREPAAWAALASVVLQTVGAFWVKFTPQQQAWSNAVVIAVLGLIVAFMARDGIIAALAGLVQAVLTLAVGLGLDWSAEKQAIVLSLVTVAVQFFVRTQVTAPVAAGQLRTPSAPPTGA